MKHKNVLYYIWGGKAFALEGDRTERKSCPRTAVSRGCGYVTTAGCDLLWRPNRCLSGVGGGHVQVFRFFFFLTEAWCHQSYSSLTVEHMCREGTGFPEEIWCSCSCTRSPGPQGSSHISTERKQTPFKFHMWRNTVACSYPETAPVQSGVAVFCFFF